MDTEAVGSNDDLKALLVQSKPVAMMDKGLSVTSSGNWKRLDLMNNDMSQLSEVSQLPTPERTPSPHSASLTMSLMGRSGAIEHQEIVDASASDGFVSLKQSARVSEQSSTAPASLPRPIPRKAPSNELHRIPEEEAGKGRRASSATTQTPVDERILKLSPSELAELTSAPDSLPKSMNTGTGQISGAPSPTPAESYYRRASVGNLVVEVGRPMMNGAPSFKSPRPANFRASSTPVVNRLELQSPKVVNRPSSPTRRPSHDVWRPSGEGGMQKHSLRGELVSPSVSTSRLPTSIATPRPVPVTPRTENPPSPLPQEIPLPPMSIPTYLQLELASSRPSPLYIHRSLASQYPFESSRIKFERLLDFLLLPPQLEHVLGFGSLACLDAWLYTFTILPLRFLKAILILAQWWASSIVFEAKFIGGFVYHGTGRMWHRQRGRSDSIDDVPPSRSESQQPRTAEATKGSYVHRSQSVSTPANGALANNSDTQKPPKRAWGRKHLRTKSQPSALSSYHKADLLQGLVIISSCVIMMYFDASRMYHSIRGQSAIKLYMIWNVLEVGDRLLAALGQDIFECLFCEETIERGPDGRSKLLRPFGMFLLAMVYNVAHAAVLFYQVITLNVAVNSYSNALLSLLMSNMFVEIKSTVFKKFEKDNIFQLTCADVVERFQLWLMLVIIGLRNIVEVGGLTPSSSWSSTVETIRNSTIPLSSKSILPASFTILSNWTGELMSPFLLVLGSEMIVDWVKHAYISKFNNVKPAIYQKFLDVLAKDYYTNAFVNQNLTKRLGLPVLPLSCLFIRASLQTYHMFLATHIPTPIPSSATALSVEHAAASPTTTAALEHFDTIIRRALGRSTFGSGLDSISKSWYAMDMDDAIAILTMITFFMCAYLVLLACKLVLGMVLLRYARNRYSSMKRREHLVIDTKGKRVGGWGMVEVDEDKRRWIYADDPDGAKALRDRDRKAAEKAKDGAKGIDFSRVTRYEMAAKRIW